MHAFSTTSDVKLKGAPLSVVQATVANALYPKQSIKVRDCSGRSGARSFLVSNERDELLSLVKVEGDSLLNSHPNTQKRMAAATQALRDHGLAPALLMTGPDFSVEAAAGSSVMQDFFHFDSDRASCMDLAKLLARLHSAPTAWWDPLKEAFAARDPEMAAIVARAPPYSPIWHLPFSGMDTGKLVMGMGSIPDATTEGVLRLQLQSGVYESVMLESAFYPVTEAARRQVVIHGDFKPDNVLRSDDGSLAAVDYDLTQVGPAVHEFGFMLPMWLGKTSVEFRREFVRQYLEASGLPHDNKAVDAFLLDCEISTITAFPGLLANIYDHEVPLLRGTPHPTAKADHIAGSTDDSPTGPEVVALLAEAASKIRADPSLSNRCVCDGLVTTLCACEGFDQPQLRTWLQQMQAHGMLALLAPELYIRIPKHGKH